MPAGSCDSITTTCCLLSRRVSFLAVSSAALSNEYASTISTALAVRTSPSASPGASPDASS